MGENWEELTGSRFIGAYNLPMKGLLPLPFRKVHLSKYFSNFSSDCTCFFSIASSHIFLQLIVQILLNFAKICNIFFCVLLVFFSFFEYLRWKDNISQMGVVVAKPKQWMKDKHVKVLKTDTRQQEERSSLSNEKWMKTGVDANQKQTLLIPRVLPDERTECAHTKRLLTADIQRCCWWEHASQWRGAKIKDN